MSEPRRPPVGGAGRRIQAVRERTVRTEMGSAGITLSSRQPSAQRQAGLLAFGSTAGPPAFPGVNRVAEYKWQPASPITVAGPRGILTRFPIPSA